MPRPKSHNPKTNAQRQAEYKARKKAQGMVRQTGWTGPARETRPAIPAPAEETPDERRRQLLDEELKAARQAGRQKERAKHYRKGYLQAMVSVCNFFVRRDRPDIARTLAAEFNITREECAKSGLDGLDLSPLDRNRVFGPDKE
jgi:hypothetical protein